MINFAKVLLLIYLLLKPFYLFGSGGIQPADIFLVASFGILFVASWITPNLRKRFFEVLGKHKFFILFVASTFLVNIFYYLYFPEFKFLMSSIYFVFNMLAIIVFVSFFKDKIFLDRVAKIFKFNLLVQLCLWIIGLGRFYSPDRYMGTFNDPNQFAYYIFISLLFVYALDLILKKRWTFIFYIISLALVVQSGSTGILLGFAIFTIFAGAYSIQRQWTTAYSLIKKVVYIFVTVSIMLASILLLSSAYGGNGLGRIIGDINNNPLVNRLDEKTQKAEGESNISLWEDRGYDTIAKYPEYIFFGSGEGAYERFVGVTNNYGNEIHATFPSILFYYGLVPLLILFAWLVKTLRGGGIRVFAPVLLALLATSFILLNQRQSLFWVLIVLCGMYGPIILESSKRRTEK